MNNRIGIYPGTFDPIHIGHITFAKQAIANLSLDGVLFIPERVHLHKSNVADFHTRIRYAKEQLRDIPEFEVIELKAVPQTVGAIRQELSELFDKSQVVMLIGSDVVRGLADWVGIADFLVDVELAVGLRGDDTVETVALYFTELEKELSYSVKYTTIVTAYKDVSSTKIRNSLGYVPL